MNRQEHRASMRGKDKKIITAIVPRDDIFNSLRTIPGKKSMLHAHQLKG